MLADFHLLFMNNFLFLPLALSSYCMCESKFNAFAKMECILWNECLNFVTNLHRHIWIFDMGTRVACVYWTERRGEKKYRNQTEKVIQKLSIFINKSLGRKKKHFCLPSNRAYNHLIDFVTKIIREKWKRYSTSYANLQRWRRSTKSPNCNFDSIYPLSWRLCCASHKLIRDDIRSNFKGKINLTQISQRRRAKEIWLYFD